MATAASDLSSFMEFLYAHQLKMGRVESFIIMAEKEENKKSYCTNNSWEVEYW
jgi:peptide subunit release factor 1 (eRF1)